MAEGQEERRKRLKAVTEAAAQSQPGAETIQPLYCTFNSFMNLFSHEIAMMMLQIPRLMPHLPATYPTHFSPTCRLESLAFSHGKYIAHHFPSLGSSLFCITKLFLLTIFELPF